jgi:hypothetical protein
MRFHFIASALSAIKHEKYTEEVDCTFRDLLKTEFLAPAVVVTWSRTKAGDWESPVTILDGSPEMVVAKAKILKALLTFAEERKLSIVDPDALLVAIERDKGEQAVMDSAARKCVPVRKLNSEDTMYRAVVDSETLIQVKAKDEDGAKSECGYRLLSLVEEDDSLSDKFHAWIKAKKPVTKVETKDQPKVQSVNVYCKRGHQRAAADLSAKKTGLKLPAAK